MGFLFKTTLFYWVVWGLTKAATTFGSFKYAWIINKWFNFNHDVVQGVPFFGEQLLALMRDNIPDGTVAFWQVWIVLGLLVGLFSPARQSARPK